MKLVSFIYQGRAYHVNPQYVTVIEEDNNGNASINVVGLDYPLNTNIPIEVFIEQIGVDPTH